MIFCSVRYLHTPWTCCKKPFMKWLSSQRGELILCSVLLLWCWHAFTWFVFHGLRLVRIAKQSMKALQKTVYETVESLWRYLSLYICFLTLCLLNSQCLNLVRFVCLWAHSDTWALHKDAPQNHSQNGWVVVEVSAWMFAFLPLCLPSSNYLNIVRFACS